LSFKIHALLTALHKLP